MEFRVLGPFDVVVDGESVPLGGAKQRALLAILAIHANEVVSADQLIDELWGERPPPSAANTLHAYISRLRKALGDVNSNASGRLIASRSPGYALRVEPDQLDSDQFARLITAAEQRLAADPEEASALLRDALALWRGRALADFAYDGFAQAEIDRLEELRLAAFERRIDLDLTRGRHTQVVAELEGLVTSHPLRERLRELLMLALYRSGRQADALETYRTGRRLLVDELGIEPGPRLQDLERAILAHDRTLEPPGVHLVRHTRQRWLVAGAALAIALATTAGGVLVLRDAEPAPAAVQVRPHSVVAVDPETNRVVADRRIGGWPMPVIRGDGYVWAANTGDDTVSRIDPVRRLVLDTFYATTPLDLAWRDQVIWIANGNSYDGPDPPGGGTVERYDVGRIELTQTRIAPPADDVFVHVAAGRDGVWAGAQSVAKVFRLDPRTGRVAAELPFTMQVSGMTVGFGSLWVSDAINDKVYRIGSRGSERDRLIAEIPVADGPRRLAVGEDAVWVLGEHPHSGVWRIDPRTNRAVAHVAVPARPAWLTLGADAVWVTSRTPGHAGPGSLARIDPKTNEVTATIQLGFSPQGVVVAGGLVWVAIGPM
jgi:DNA-binding SARP family transcriptional activator/DNA-binding beta-propeller fold protein YncE